jgi:hypothetical protein
LNLVNSPKETVLNVYKHFNWEVSEKFSAHLDREEVRQKNYVSNHDYSLDKYSLSKEYIYERLFDVFHEFGFEK